jgi:hypothetical protein
MLLSFGLLMKRSTRHKALIFFAARDGQKETLAGRIEALARQLLDSLPGTDKIATGMVSRDNDFLRSSPGPVRAYDATIELATDVGGRAFVEATAGLGERVTDVAHADLSALLVGQDLVFVDCEPQPIRVQYLMRRRADFSHEAYLKRYEEVHSQLGVQQGGVRGYVQFHVNLELSCEAARSAGFGICAIDNVSELHIASLKEFAQALGQTDVEAVVADEELFVDRPNSVMFTSDEVIRL